MYLALQPHAFVATAGRALLSVISHVPETRVDRVGGYLTVAIPDYEGHGADLVFSSLIGTVPDCDDMGTRLQSVEKAMRVLGKHEREGHLLSSQSRDPASRQFGGGICVPSREAGLVAIGFAGMGDPQDEAIAIVTASGTGLLTAADSDRYARLGKNLLAQQLFP